MARIDYYDDPAAPAANSVVPSANVVVVNDEGALLVIHRTDNDNWAFPGGALDLGESLVTTAVREVKEETGIDCEVTGLVGIYTDPKHIIFYTSDGEARQEFSVLFTARPTGGTPAPSSESREVRWVPREQILGLAMDRSMRMRVQHYLEARPEPYLGGAVEPSPWLDVGANLFSSVGTVGAFAVAMFLLRKEHKREERHDEEARRSQAVKVSAWIEARPIAYGGRELAFHVHNASEMPIYEVSLPMPIPTSDGQANEAEFIGLVPPGQTVQRPAPKEWTASYFSPEPVEIEFMDSSGQHWTRDEQGFLTCGDNYSATPSP